MQIFNTISTTDRVTLTVERNGQTQQLNVNTAQIELPDPSAPTTGMPPQDGQPNGTDASFVPAAHARPPRFNDCHFRSGQRHEPR